MAKINKEFLIKEQYIHEYYENTDIYPFSIHHRKAEAAPEYFNPPQLSNVEFLISHLESLLIAKDAEAIKRFLNEDFILQDMKKPISEDNFHTDSSRERQGRIKNYVTYQVRPNLEVLLLEKPEIYRQLLSNCRYSINQKDIAIKQVLLQALSQINLDENESINFAGMNLEGASFKGAKLSLSYFGEPTTTDKSTEEKRAAATTFNVDFDGCDLSACSINQDQLDASKSYDQAKVPMDCSVYWNEAIRKEIAKRFDNMFEYAKKNIGTEDPKYIKIQTFHKEYYPKLMGSEKLTANDKKNMLDNLTSKESMNILGTHRNLRFLLKEIVSFILGVGVLYLAASAYQKHKTGHFGLFAQPKMEKAALEIHELASSRNIAAPCA